LRADPGPGEPTIPGALFGLRSTPPEIAGADIVSGAATREPALLAFSFGRRVAAEALGTGMLLAVVIGSGIMGERLAGGNVALALLGNTLATGAALVVLITIFGPISGAHFNPAVTLAFLIRRELTGRTALAFMAAQLAGAIVGVWISHVMFAEAVLQVSTKTPFKKLARLT